jgi:glycine cleavage system regulatory protein
MLIAARRSLKESLKESLARRGEPFYHWRVNVPLVMTVIGRDRPGLVERVARVVADHGGNWLESRMCRLGGEFAGLLRVHIPEDQRAALAQALQALKDQGLTVIVRVDTAAAGAAGRIATLDLVGQDRPGIVKEISRVLAARGLNVEELTTECSSAPMSGEPLFRAQARLFIPAACDLAALRAELERIAADLLVEIGLSELTDSTAAGA